MNQDGNTTATNTAPHRAATIRRMRAAGLSFREIGERLDVSHMTVKRVMDGAGPAASRAPDESLRRRICTLREKGHSMRAIADFVGVSHGKVFTVLAGQRKGDPSPLPTPANDNRRTIEVANNGGCSTTSGMVRVTVARSAGGELQQVAA